jgi:DAACS family dicarboxylate/amino acid:cation (Na+ or H+) symporter
MSAAESAERSGGGHVRILVGLAAGILLGLAAHSLQGPDGKPAELVSTAVSVAEPVGRIFLRLMQMVVLPLVVSALFLAVVDVGDLRRLGRIGLTTLFFPGRAISVETQEALTSRYRDKAGENVSRANAAKSLGQTLVDLLPENPVQEMVGAVDGSSKGNGMLAVMFFALLAGIAATMRPAETQVLTGTLRGMYEISMTVIGWALQLAPLGAGCLVFSVTAQMGTDILRALAAFVGVVIGGLLLHLLGVYSVVLVLFAKWSPVDFFRRVSSAMFVAFSTSSSSATLSTSLKVAHDELKLTPETANFVLTVGATGNQNGTALFEGVVVLFLAQVFGVELSLSQQITVVLMSVLAGVGTAGVPGGSIPLIIVVLKTVGVPADGIAIVLGVDRILDMSRTLVNVVGDLVVAACVDVRLRPSGSFQQHGH